MSPRKNERLSMEYVILGVLYKTPMHGYELHQTLQNMPGISRIWSVKQALLYAKLEKLERSGYITILPQGQEDNLARHVYQLTPSGAEVLSSWLREPVDHTRDIRQEFIAKLLISFHTGLGNIPSLISTQKAQCVLWLSDLNQAQKDGSPGDWENKIVSSYRIAQIEAVIAWLEGVESEVLQRAVKV